MPLPTTIDDLSTTASLNYPAGSDVPSVLDDTQRVHASFIAQLRDANELFITTVEGDGGGVVDDTAEWTAKLALGVSLFSNSDRAYKITSGLTVSANNQHILGGFTFVPVGNFNLLTFSGGATNVGISGPHVNAAGMTGGYVYKVDDAHRVTIENSVIDNPFNVIYAQKTNTCLIQNVWAGDARGAHGIHLYGTPSVRTDLVNIFNVTMSGSAAVSHANRITGLTIDGNVHTVSPNNLYVITPSRGVHVKNSTGGTYPATVPSFIEADTVQIDYPYTEGIRDEIGQAHHWVNSYLANSVTDVGYRSLVDVVDTTIQGGICVGNAKEGMIIGGIDTSVSDIKVAFNSIGAGNLGSYSGIVCAGTSKRTSFSGVHSGLSVGSGAVQKFGLDVQASAETVSWTGGSLAGNLQAPWNDSSGIPLANFSVIGAAGCGMSIMNNMIFGTDAGFGARATPTITAGAVASIAVTAGGQHYEAAPSVFAYDPLGTGSGFTAGAVTRSAGVITAIAVTAGGASYSAGTIIYILPVSTTPYARPYYPGTADLAQRYMSKGTGQILLSNDQSVAFSAASAANGVNYLTALGSATGTGPQLVASGADANLDIIVTPKGTGLARVFATLRATGAIFPGTAAAAEQSVAGLTGGNGVPNNANGSDGWYYFRNDGGAGASIYKKLAGTWTAIA